MSLDCPISPCVWQCVIPPVVSSFVGLGTFGSAFPASPPRYRHTHTRARAPDSRAPIKRLAQGTDREANGRERPCPRTVLAWPAREKRGRGVWYGWRGRGDSLGEGRCGGVCPAFSVRPRSRGGQNKNRSASAIQAQSRRFKAAASGNASPAFFRPMDGPLPVGVEVRLGLVVKGVKGWLSGQRKLLVDLYFIKHC